MQTRTHTDRPAAAKRRRLGTLARRLTILATTLALVAIGCGGDERSLSGPPVGEPVLPDLVPEPPDTLHTMRDNQGVWTMRFTSTIVNVGDGDFILHGDRTGDQWSVEQQIAYSHSGSELVPTEATMVFAGDGHDHWHVERVATYRLERADGSGVPIAGAEGRADTKVGFCFYDSHKKLDGGPGKAQFSRLSCGKQSDTQFRMGLSPSWGDVYDFTLPGQSVNITDLSDGRYRLWAETDPRAWFREVTRDNNVTWIDLELTTQGPEGTRLAKIVATGPRPA
jgi:hypothetical protein